MDQFRSRSSHDGLASSRSRATHSHAARIATRILLLLALASSSLALTQCKMVGDRLTGVSADLLKRKSDCARSCKDTAKEQKKAENQAHSNALRNCGGDPACVADENARYQAALQAIEAAFVACVNGCHSQGGGTVGR